MSTRKPFVLCVLDGWGVAPASPENGITSARTPVWDDLCKKYPSTTLKASGEAVGLPPGQMGNSEVGHMTLGAGRVMLQDLPRINQAIQDGSFLNHPLLRETCAVLKHTGKAFHIFGLLSDGGVHSHISHLATLFEFLGKQNIPVWFHAFLDGRDAPPQSASGYVAQIQKIFARYPLLQWATVGGRAFGMDRNQRWERTQKAYQEIVFPSFSRNTQEQASIQELIEKAYQQGITRDEDIPPFALKPYPGVRPGDAFLFMNFRVDRMRQLASALADPSFKAFPQKIIELYELLSLTDLSQAHRAWISPLFPQKIPKETLGEILATHRLKQLRLAETEKYAHVTFFFNGGREELFEGEDRLLIPSPHVASYDLQPEMSAPELTEQLVKAITSKAYDFIVVNYANPDMVGHTAEKLAIIKAIETVDSCIGKVAHAIQAAGGTLLITADHGNAEVMRDPQTGQPHTAHTCHEVPCVLVNGSSDIKVLRDHGELQDVAPTVLKLLGLQPSLLMKGCPLC
ncbi:MAG: 2,3-bisphosphoglycerate-independent phosphoglycerate mutase [Alphaproteobacteria bacterium]